VCLLLAKTLSCLCWRFFDCVVVVLKEHTGSHA
jgi:hypothetical protein